MSGYSKPFALRLQDEEREALEALQASLEGQLGVEVNRGEALRHLLLRWRAWEAGGDPWQAGYQAGYTEGRKAAYHEHRAELAGRRP